MKTFSIRKSLSFAWDKVTSNLGFFIPATLIILVASLLPMPLEESEIFPAALFSLVSAIVSCVLSIWAIRIGLDAVRGRELSYKNFFPSWEVFWKFFVSNILVTVLAGIPILIMVLIVIFVLTSSGALSFVDGNIALDALVETRFIGLMTVSLLLGALAVYVSMRLYFSVYLVVDRLFSPVSALRESWNLTRGMFWKLFALSVVLTLVLFAGVAALFVGIFVSFPIALVAIAHVYRELADSTTLESLKEEHAETNQDLTSESTSEIL